MDSKSGGPPFSDPDQWWQPDYQLDPNYDSVSDPYSPFFDAASVIAGFDLKAFVAERNAAWHSGGYHNPRQAGKNASYSLTNEEHKPHQQHMHVSIREAIAPFKDAFERVAAPINEAMRLLNPVMDAVLPHHEVCDHKPRCRKPGPGAAFASHAGKSKRPRTSNR